MDNRSEEQDGVTEAEIILKSENFRRFEEDPANLAAIVIRTQELVDKATLFKWENMDMLTQVAVGHFIVQILNKSGKIDMNDLKYVLAIGMAIANEEGEKR